MIMLDIFIHFLFMHEYIIPVVSNKLNYSEFIPFLILLGAP